MTNEGNPLTHKFLEHYGFERVEYTARNGCQVVYYTKDYVDITDNTGRMAHSGSPFSFTTFIDSDNDHEGGFMINTDQQLKNLFFALRGKELEPNETYQI